MLRKTWNVRSVCWAFTGLLAINCGCRESPQAAKTSIVKPPKAETTSSQATIVPKVDPGAVAEDGTVLLEPPKQSSKEPRLDVIVDTPTIPADAKFGDPTPADPLPSESKLVTKAEVAKAEVNNADKLHEVGHVAHEGQEISNLATADELNQKIAEDWPKPQAVLLLTGQQHGYLEPCGCTGLERQKGGIIRRDTLLTQLKDRGWSVVPVDVGNQVRRRGAQPKIQFRVTADAFKLMDYKAVTLGVEDLLLSGSDLLQVAGSENVEKNPGMFISANTSVLAPEFWPKTQVVEVGGRKIGITAYLGEEFRRHGLSDEVIIEDAVASLKSAVTKLKADGCNYLVLLAHASQADSQTVAAAVPGFDLVVTAGGLGEPRNVLDPIPGSTAMISQVGTKGMYACIVGLFDDAQTPVRYQRIAISSQFKDSPRMLEVFKEYQLQLKNEGFEKLGLKPSPNVRGQYVGSETCGDCHTTAFEVWKNTPHFHATDSIVHPTNDRGNIPRHFDPECVSCHVTGWDPQKFTPFESGYWSLESTPKLVGSGCENCHGPGAEHVKAENGEIEADNELLTKLREQMRLPLQHADTKCVECHDLDNSPEFVFDKYWNEVKHVGKN